jgi:hypothetical protein
MTILKSYKALLKDGKVYQVDEVYKRDLPKQGQHIEYHLTRNGETKVVEYNDYWDLEPITGEDIFETP